MFHVPGFVDDRHLHWSQHQIIGDHFEILATEESDLDCKIKETLFEVCT